MKLHTRMVPVLAGLGVLALLTGCLNLQLGGGSTTKPQAPTVGQQLMDLQKARDSGAISDAEYTEQRSKILNTR